MQLLSASQLEFYQFKKTVVSGFLGICEPKTYVILAKF
jgi:hypothetical protein